MNPTMLTIGSLFAGIGGMEKGLEDAGLGPVLWQVEINPYCRAVLARHWPNATRYSDVVTVTGLAPVDVICGGFPCQDVSGAGKRVGMSGARSGLWSEFARIVSELHPRFVVVENVASGKGRWLPTVRAQLCELGYGTRAYALSAADVGAPHLRRRVFVVGEHIGISLGNGNGNGNGLEDHEPPGAAARAAVADSDSERLRDGAERMPGGRARGVQREGRAESQHASEAVAHGHGHGRERESARGVHGPRQSWDDAARRHRFPPRRGDEDAWASWRSCSGPEPGIRRGADGIPGRVDDPAISANIATDAERLEALGNAVVPQCAEVIGRLLLEMVR